MFWCLHPMSPLTLGGPLSFPRNFRVGGSAPESGDSLTELVTLNLALQVPQTCGREGHWELRKPLDLALEG